MAAPTTTSARAPEMEQSHTSLNEPSMEDILASIRRIIAEDQSNSLGRSGLSGLTRRPAAPMMPVAEEASAPQAESAALAHLPESDLHAAPQGDGLLHTYEAPAEVAPSFVHEAPAQEPVAEQHDEPSFSAMPSYDAAEDQSHATGSEFELALSDGEQEPLMSPTTGASITSSFQTLAESVMLQDPGLIERVMRDSMRPLLKAWLDDHLPSIVERLVRAEIERVARGGRARNA